MSKDVGFGASRLRFKKFDLNEMCEHATIALIAKRASGKSVLVKEIMKKNASIPSSVVICKTEKLNRSYGKNIPDSYIYYDFDADILDRIFSRQKRLIADNEKRQAKKKTLKDDRVMLIMDDCMSDKKWVKDPTVLELFFNGRHYHISFILTMQYSKGIPPGMRSNLDYIFLLAEDFYSRRKSLYEDYAGMFPSFDVFQQVFTELTDNYGCMVINNRVHSKNIEDKVFWYKANVEDDFHMGGKHYNKFHDKFYDPKWDKKIPLFNFNKSKTRKNKLNLIVEKEK
ncbi:putative VV A32-like packaging ATPase [Cafeteria roenbergensis virus]|uniref:Putative VV A32-like packaging ATPase n=1 Tax=Cafeteria roenbergensis virus (strain BV-PW1) TaxID=693272 RepID=E3T5A9_CROVB|nr:putative VV A32-like packaging ATPase [Cafeteria roenbergensis virus BV-PW1]ADO67372.1 putative VV A32-like packaging ATPase [Cafeteria roenbergensis virus BV-PW1]